MRCLSDPQACIAADMQNCPIVSVVGHPQHVLDPAQTCIAVLQAAEQHRKSVIDAALLQATQAMNDIAYLSPGDVERLVEQQALDLNLSILDNRCGLPV